MVALNLKKDKKYWAVIGSIIIIFLITLYYNILFDMLLISILFLSSYLLGNIILRKIEINNKNIVSTALGLGVLGVIFYLLLLFNVGKKSFFAVALIIPIILGNKYIKSLALEIKNELPKTKKDYILFICISMFFIFYIAYGSAPMSKYDTMTKHLPITIFGAEKGRFNYNVIQSMVYGESMVMNYTYSIMFASFNAFKSITLFNVVINFLIFKKLVIFSKCIHKNTDILFLAILYFSTPMFFEFSTIFYLDILPIYFLLGAILCFVNLNKKEAWVSLPIVAFLFGCSVFAKITISYAVFITGSVAVVLCILYSYKNKSLSETTKYLFGSFLLFISPFIVSLINIWYRTGNPLFPFYNNIFQSSYFPTYEFGNPFGKNPLGLTIDSLFQIVFQTSRNIEMHNGGLGLFMLLIFIIPIAMLINGSKRFIVWSVIPFAIFGMSCLFTDNLRYNMSIFIILLSIISISVAIIYDRINLNLNLKRTMIYILLIVLFFPNVVYIRKNYDLKGNLKPNSQISKKSNESIMNEIPENKKVLSLNDPLMGEYKGFFSAYMWHNYYNMNKITNGLITIEDYISCFDYIIYQKNLDTYSPLINEIVFNAGNKDSILIPYNESSNHILYKVKEKEPEIIFEENLLEEPKVSTTSQPIIHKIDKAYGKYQITQDVENITDKDIEMRFQINWHDKEGNFLDTSISTYTLAPGRKVDTSSFISHYNGAEYGIVYITTHNNEKVLVHGYRVDGYEGKSKYLSEEIEMYNRREKLND